MLTYETKPISARRPRAAPVPMLSFCTHVNCTAALRGSLRNYRTEHEESANVDAHGAGFSSRKKVLGIAPFDRSSGVRKLACFAIEFSCYKTGGNVPCRGRMRVAGEREHLREHGCGQRPASHAVLGDRPRLVEAEPYARDDIRGYSDEPHVGVLVGCARLAGDGHTRRQEAANRGGG